MITNKKHLESTRQLVAVVRIRASKFRMGYGMITKSFGVRAAICFVVRQFTAKPKNIFN